ncbi:TonB-dependent receptor [Flavihumibacter petaseus]|uniref:Putative TonB-dependent receptor n=1 Tax=Flavihumibacter petaseus NBRC 106054 TaxID=1220578 RepID=A0A0E9N5P9_9BACT|nr:TonB-dependent receptor [Flavihumibacter petaseus]GAO44670.1 putative TonB-dependent receptor [Flavihumibacter petaseus NBRC 106054]
MKALYVLTIALLLCSAAYTQTIIKGKITDQQSGEVLPGATIANGKTVITASDKGEFEIRLTDDGTSLAVSYAGYETKVITVPANTGFVVIGMNSSNINLSTVVVTGYENNRRLLETAGAIGVLKASQLQRGDNRDIMAAMNTVPGVKMEAYSTGNYRIAIRGSLLNNPWGIRNVRVYWNDLPLSSPDGTTQKSIDFDPALIGSVEVLKGPSGSMYGAGNGGVLLIRNTKAGADENSLETGYTAGSYGYSRFEASYKTSGENFNIAANVVSQRYDGYRENNWGNKDVINLFSQFKTSEKRTLNLFVTHVTGSLGIAGALNAFQADSMPRQAGQYNKDNKTSVKKYDATAFGVSQTYRFSSHFTNTTGVYGNFQTYDHPFGTGIYYNGYLKESLTGYGGRTRFVYAPVLGSISSRFSIGGEYQYQHQFGNTFTVINDEAGSWPETGDLYQNDIVVSKSAMLFAQAEFDLPRSFFLTLGASYTNLSYDILDMLKTAGHVDYSGLLQFPDKISPRIGLVKTIGKNLAVHGSISSGYSPPPVWEINNYDGTLNKDIQPEGGVNYEIGFRGNMLNSKLNLDVTAYQMNLKNAIVPVAQANGTTAYKNAGATNQKGIEAAVSYLLLSDREQLVSLLKPWISYTFNDYRFRDYKTQSYDDGSSSVITVDNSGKKVTGVVPNSVAAGVDLDTRPGIYLNTTFYYYDKVPLNDANTYYADAYALLNLKIGYRKTFNRIGLDLSCGVNNVTDTQYSSLLLYNADATAYGAPPQFYNPSPGINYYGGARLKYSFK